MAKESSGSGVGGKDKRNETGEEILENMIMSEDQAEKYFDKYFQSWYGGLNEGEKDDTHLYTGSSYSEINGVQRTPEQYSETQVEAMQDIIGNIHSGLSKFVLKKDIVVQRGSSAALLGGVTDVNMLNDMKGQIFTDKAFTSTSAARSGVFDDKVHYIIKVPKGVGRGAYIKPISKFKSENEFLMQNNSHYRLDRAVDKGGQLTVYMTVVGNG